MASSNLGILSGLQDADDGSSKTPGAVPIYNADGSITQNQPTPTSGLGGNTIRLPLREGRNQDGSVIATSATSGGFAISATTVGASLSLLSEGAKNNAKDDTVAFEIVMPQFYKAGDPVTLSANGLYNANSGTVSGATLSARAFAMSDAGTISGSNLITTAGQTLTTSAANYSFPIAGTGLTAGGRLVLALEGVIRETANAGTNSTIQLNSIKING